MTLEAIKYTPGRLEVLDQLQLPHTTHYDLVHNSRDAWDAIKQMRTRGAPAIAIVAALGLAVELSSLSITSQSASDLESLIHERLEYLVTARPTAVNLADAAAKLRAITTSAAKRQDATAESVKEAYLKAAQDMLAADVADNKAIGQYGAEWILSHSESTEDGKVNILTHCNTGSLATAGYGTALGIIRSLSSTSRLATPYCTETRPYNQGARLTAYELVYENLSPVLVTDSMAAALLSGLRGPIAAVVVGADRVAANGDTANKIGTYALAVLARYHGVKFVVAAPRTSVDRATGSGKEISIEHRPEVEVVTLRAPEVGSDGKLGGARTVRIAAQGVEVWNPAFDVTPAELIDAIVTEKGVVEKGKDGKFNFDEVFAQ